MTLYSAPIFFFFNDTATTEIYTLSLHDALPICSDDLRGGVLGHRSACGYRPFERDRKSTRLNSSHGYLSYAVFCLKKKNNSILRSPERVCCVTHRARPFYSTLC